MAQPLNDEELTKARQLMTAITPDGVARMAKWMQIEDLEKQLKEIEESTAIAIQGKQNEITALHEQLRIEADVIRAQIAALQ